MRKRILFVINTLGYGGAERAMLDLLTVLEPEKYEISLFVLTGQGELIRELPEHVRLLNQNYKEVSVLTKEGRKLLMRSVLRAGIGKGLFLRRFPYLLKNSLNMRRNGKILPDKLCWRLLSDGAPIIKKEYDLAVAYLEGGATYYVAEHVNAKKKVVSPKLQDRPPIIYRLRSVPTIWAQTTFNPFEVSPYFEGKALFAFARRYMYYTPLQDECQSSKGG